MNKCVSCGYETRGNLSLHRHHINNSIRDQWDNKSGRTILLCSGCHGKIHKYLKDYAFKFISYHDKEWYEKATNEFLCSMSMETKNEIIDNNIFYENLKKELSYIKQE